MAKNNAVILGVVVVVIVAAAAYFIINNGDDGKKDGASGFSVGDTMSYQTFGYFFSDGSLIEGSVSVKIVDVTDTQYQLEQDNAIYKILSDGTKEPMKVGTTVVWQNKDLGYTDKGSLTVDTFWGKKTLQYTESKEEDVLALGDGPINYAQMVYYDDFIYYLELTDCSLIKEKKVSRSTHEVDIELDAEIEYAGEPVYGKMIARLNNKDTAVFKQMVTTSTVYNDERVLETRTTTVWLNPFDFIGTEKSGTETISTEWGDKNVDVYKWSESDGKVSVYSYGMIYVRKVVEKSDFTMTFDASAITVDGKDATLDEAAAVF